MHLILARKEEVPAACLRNPAWKAQFDPAKQFERVLLLVLLLVLVSPCITCACVCVGVELVAVSAEASRRLLDSSTPSVRAFNGTRRSRPTLYRAEHHPFHGEGASVLRT